MTWSACKIDSSKIVKEPSGRTWDPDSGLELFAKPGGRREYMEFHIKGPDISLAFHASLTEAPLDDSERRHLNIHDGIVWCVYAGIPKGNREKKIISCALAAYKLNHGFTIKNLPAFVRFGLDGEIFDG